MTREAYLKLIGPLPTAVPLDVKVLESVDCGSFIREKIEYSVELNERVPAYLLVPKKPKPGAPAIFCYHQHNGEFHLGKSEVVGLKGHPDQAYARELAERGYVTLAPDAIGFEERNWSGGTERSCYFELASRLIQGKTLLAKVLHDVRVGLDYLASRPEVDAARLGFIGHSYGGRMALWAPAFDKRIKVSVSNCGCVNYKDSLFHDVGIQMEFCVPGIIQSGDIEDVVRLIEPNSLFILATDDDCWSRGAKAMGEYAKSAFVKGKFKVKEWAGKHQFNDAMKAEAYAYLDENL
jgi:dienelactone hydrolase